MNDGWRETMHGLLPAYALNALDDAQRAMVEQALERDAELRRALAEYLATVAAISTSLAPAVPSAALRQRVLGSRAVLSPAAGQGAARGTPAWPAVPRSWTAAAVLLLAVVGFAGVAVAQQSRINALHDDVDAAHTRIAEQKDQMRTLEAQVSSAEATLVKQRALTYWAALPGVTTAVISPAATMTPEASGVGGNPRAMYMVSSDNSTSLLVVIDLPRLPEGLAYQAWFVAPGEAPVSAFTFLVGDSGYGQFNFVPPENVDAFTAMAVTVEPIGGSMEPTGPLVLAGDFTQR